MGALDIANQLAQYFKDSASQGQDYAEKSIGKDNYDKAMKGSMNMAMGSLGAEDSAVGTLKALMPEAKNAHLFDQAFGHLEGESPEFMEHLLGKSFKHGENGPTYTINKFKSNVPNPSTAVEVTGPGGKSSLMPINKIMDEGFPINE